MIKIAFFDVDGTLVDMERKVISETMVETLNRLKEQGIRICIATGRAPITLPKIPDVAFDAYMTFNGSYCYNQEDVILNNPISAKDVQTIIRNAKAINRPVSLATKDRLGANGKDKDLVDYFSIVKLVVESAEDFEAFSREEIYQIMMGGYKSEYDAILKDVENAKITAWWDRAVDVIPGDGGKGKGVKAILDYYGLEPCEAIAFGDGNNDIEMLQSVGTGVAMENASDELKSVATEVCGHVAEEGIYHYCKEHGLI